VTYRHRDPHPELSRSQSSSFGNGKIVFRLVRMLDEARPEAAIVTTRMTGIWKFCVNAQSATSTIHGKTDGNDAADAREMERLLASGHQADGQLLECLGGSEPRSFSRGEIGSVGPVQRIIVQYGHRARRRSASR